MKTILVTGAAGYIGRHVVKNALDRGYRVIAADFNFKGVDERAEFCDEPLFSGEPDLYRKLGSPDICICFVAVLCLDLSGNKNERVGNHRQILCMESLHAVGFRHGRLH